MPRRKAPDTDTVKAALFLPRDAFADLMLLARFHAFTTGERASISRVVEQLLKTSPMLDDAKAALALGAKRAPKR